PPTEQDLQQNKCAKPVSFLQACALQWINPKGWAMAVGATATYNAIAPYPYNALFIAFTFVLTGIGSSFTWAGLGSVLQRFLHKPK
ncbi:hypothetical protein ACSTKK_00185, partial [Vibrio parahaemolyticus]